MGVRLLRSRGLLDPRPRIVEQLGWEPLKAQGEKGENAQVGCVWSFGCVTCVRAPRLRHNRRMQRRMHADAGRTSASGAPCAGVLKGPSYRLSVACGTRRIVVTQGLGFVKPGRQRTSGIIAQAPAAGDSGYMDCRSEALQKTKNV